MAGHNSVEEVEAGMLVEGLEDGEDVQVEGEQDGEESSPASSLSTEDEQVKSEPDGEGVHCAGAAGRLCTVQQVEEVVQMQVQVKMQVKIQVQVKEVELQPALLLVEEEWDDMQAGQDIQAARKLLQLAVVGILLLRGEEKGQKMTPAASWQL